MHDLGIIMTLKSGDFAERGDVSASYATQVSGEVTAILGKNLRSGNIWEGIELPRLKLNPKVTKITTIDPETMKEIIIFTR